MRTVIGVLTVPLDDGCETMTGRSLATTVDRLKEQGAAACFTAFYGKSRIFELYLEHPLH